MGYRRGIARVRPRDLALIQLRGALHANNPAAVPDAFKNHVFVNKAGRLVLKGHFDPFNTPWEDQGLFDEEPGENEHSIRRAAYRMYGIDRVKDGFW